MDDKYQKEATALLKERDAYLFNEKKGVQMFEFLSTFFHFAGLFSLILIFFTDLTIIQATCIFVIGHTLKPTDLDSNKTVFKGLTEDIANIRVYLSLIRNHIEGSQNNNR